MRIIIQMGRLTFKPFLKDGETQYAGAWTCVDDGELFAAFRDEAPHVAAVGWNPEVAVRNLLKMEEEPLNN